MTNRHLPHIQDLNALPLEEVEQSLPAAVTDREAVDLYNYLATRLLHINRQRAVELSDKARMAAETLHYPIGQAKAMVTLGFLQPDPQQGIALLKDCLPIMEREGQPADRLPIYKNLALLSRNSGDLDSALQYAQQAVDLCQAHQLTERLGNSLSLLATIYITTCDYARSLQLMQEALPLLEQHAHKAEIASACSNLTALYFNLENFDKAEEYARKTSLNYKEAEQTLLYAEALMIEGQCLGRNNKPEESLTCFEAALVVAQQIGYKELIAEISVNLGSLHLLKHNHAQARTYFEQGLEQCTAMKLLQPQVFALLGLGNLFKLSDYAERNLPVAESYLTKALSLADANGLKWETREITAALADLYETMGRWQAAFEHQKQFIRLEKEISTSESRNKLTSFEIEKQLALAVREKEVADRILHNILPQKIAEQLRSGEEEIIERYEHATVLFADIVGFTTWSKHMPVADLAKTLNKIFSLFDELAQQFKVEKIKTIGDSYMCVAGLPELCDDHAERIARMGCAMITGLQQLFPGGEIQLRIGIQTGEVIAGVLGKNKYAYDLWGDTVNTASRMESHSLPNHIQVTEEVKQLLAGKFNFKPRPEMEVKGKGKMNVYFLEPLG